MKPFSSSMPIVVIAALGVLAGPASAAPPTGYAIDNHQRHVTVRDGSGSLAFSQVIPTDAVKIVGVARGRASTLLTLQDASGKTLWSKTVPVSLGPAVKGDWIAESGAAMDQASSSLRASGRTPLRISTISRAEAVIGPGDHLESFRISFGAKDGRHDLSVVRRPGGYASRLDGRALPPAPHR